MSRNPERAENPGVFPESRPSTKSIIPRQLRVSALGARAFLTVLTASAGAAALESYTEAAATCTGQLLIVGVKFADHPTLGRRRILDLTDFYLGNADFRVAEIFDQIGKDAFDRWDKKDLSKKPKPIASGNLSDKGAYSLARVPFSGECDDNQGQAKRVWLAFELDRDLAMYPEVVRNNTTRFHLAGRDEHRVSELQGFVDDKNFPIKKVGQFIQEISKEVAGTTIAFTDPGQFTGDSKTISEANRQKLREQIAKLVREQEEARKVATPTVGQAPSAIETSTPAATLTPDKLAIATPAADKTPTPTSGAESFLRGVWGGAGAAINFVTDLPAKAVDQITEPDSQGSVRTGVDIAGWLALLALLRLLRRVPNAAVTAGTTGSTGSSIPPTFSLGGIIGALGGPSNPNTAPSTGPAQPKTPNPEWITGQQEFEKKWQAAKIKLPPVQSGDTGSEPEYILDRFKAGMNTIHEVSLDDVTIRVSRMAVRIRAGIEYLIPEIWSDSGIFKKFFDPQINAGFLTAEDLAKIIYLPEQYRALSKFTDVQRKDVRRIHRILMHALHADTSKSDADPNLQDTIDDLLKKINPAWSYIDRLIK